jgi:hypothetical protein
MAMALRPRITVKRTILLVAVVLAAGLTYWLASPLFITSHAEESTPEAFTVVVKQGTWQGADDFHRASGFAKILTDGQGRYLLRLEEFSVTNGPDIRFFLSEDASVGAGDLDLGPVPATTGSYNVPIPQGTDLAGVNYVVVHCVPFSVPFGSAHLS